MAIKNVAFKIDRINSSTLLKLFILLELQVLEWDTSPSCGKRTKEISVEIVFDLNYEILFCVS